MLIALMCAPFISVWADSETINFGSLGLENGVQYSDPFGTNISVTFGGGGNDGKYYNTGTGIRTYNGGTITITAKGNTITAIQTTFSGVDYAPASADVWSSDGTGSGTSGVSASWEGSATEVVITRPTSTTGGHWRLQAIKVTYVTEGPPACETPTFSPAAGTYLSAQNVEISTTTEGATIYYTVDGSEPTEESTAYTEAIAVSKTTTIKAIAVKAEFSKSAVASATYKIVAFEHAGTSEDPYTVADARIAIDTGAGVSGVYATGIVSKIVTAYNSQYGNITYNISADGSTEGEQLQAFRGKGKDGEWFISNYDVMVGDVVVIYGDLTKYGSTYEFAADNQLVSLKRNPVEVTVGESGYATMYLPYAVESGGILPSSDLPTPVGAWTFDDPDNPLAGTGTATLTPAIHGTNGNPNEGKEWLETKESLEDAGITILEGGALYIPKGSSLLMNTNNGATGFDKYTVMFDICSDDMTGYTPLWQNSMADDKDGSLFIKNGQMGLGGSLGYKGNFTAGQWYRVVLVIDTPNKAALYVDGEMLSSCEHTDSYNKHWLLQGPGAVFFADEDGEEKAIKVTGLRFWDVPFTLSQVAALGTVSKEAEVGIVKVPESVGTWTFDDADNLTAGTGVATMTATSGVVVNEDGSVTVAEGDNLKITTNLPEAKLDSYTLMMDVKFPDVSRYTSLIQTDLSNTNDACLFVHNGQVGINSGGLYYHGSLEVDTWYRFVFVVDNLIASEYVDGVLIGKGSSQLAKWGISDGAFFLFEDEDADNDEGVATTTEIRLWDQALTPAQVEALGTMGSELKAFTGVVNGEYLTLNEVPGTIPAFTPVVLKGAPNTYVFDMAENVAPIEENDLKGTLEDIDAAGKYVLAQPEDEPIGFYLADGGTIKAGKAYLESASGVRAFYFSGDDATAIENVNADLDTNRHFDGAIYNLAGQRISKMQKGINIINGKKILK